MKVEYQSEEFFPFDKRLVWYRKDLSDVPWWKRLFMSNPWHKVYCSYTFYTIHDHTVKDCLKFWFRADEANEIAEKYKTVEELEEFLNEEYAKAERMLKEHLKLGDWRF